VFVRLRPLSEQECYVRCYGGGDVSVRVLRIEPRAPHRYEPHLSGEALRRLFEERLDAREPEAA
jgi:hypothetical protein